MPRRPTVQMLLRRTIMLGECVELVYQPLRVDPTQRVASNGELAGGVAEDHCLSQKPMRRDGTP